MLNIPRSLVDDMIAHARAEDPNECCGLIAGVDGTAERGYRITNETPSPYRYKLDSQQQFNAEKDAERRGLSPVAFYHSHTHGAPYPSSTDVRLAISSGYVDELIYYILVSLENKVNPEVRLYTVTRLGEIIEVELRVD